MATITERRAQQVRRQLQVVRYWIRAEEQYAAEDADWSYAAGSGPYATREAAEDALREARRDGYAGAFVSQEICFLDSTDPVQRNVALQLCQWREREEIKERQDAR